MRVHTLVAVILVTGGAVGLPAVLDGTVEARSPNASKAIASGMVSSRAATLHHDPRFILDAVAQRMGVRLRPDIPVPAILLESATPLQRLQRAGERQWGFRPQIFVNAYAPAENGIYLIDDADFHRTHKRTLDDALAHEFVHYLQANYLGTGLHSEWSEAEAVMVQTWFREKYMAPVLAAGARQ